MENEKPSKHQSFSAIYALVLMQNPHASIGENMERAFKEFPLYDNADGLLTGLMQAIATIKVLKPALVGECDEFKKAEEKVDIIIASWEAIVAQSFGKRMN